MVDIREKFIVEVRNSIQDFKHFTQTNIINYCTIMHDDRIQTVFSTFAKYLLNKYREISEDSGYEPPNNIQTRCGRKIKRPNKLNL